jgi:ATP-dependent DNA helicase DinG
MQAEELLGSDGPFAETLDGFMPRKGQQGLSGAIENVLQNNQTLIAEAGTGIGKTFAYLVPVLASGKKTLISTGTRHLQDQLFHNDLPIVMKSLGYSVSTALLKGRSNYLCTHRMNIAHQQGYITTETQDHLQRIKEWSKSTLNGDVAEMSVITEDARVWPLVTSTGDNCLGAECPDWKDCFVVKARKEAQEADVVVINHHLLLADMAIKDEGFGELLPAAEAFVIDEAHQLAEVATRFFGKTISSRQLTGLINDSTAEQVADAPDMPEIRFAAETLKNSMQDFRLALGNDNQKDAWAKIANKPALVSARQVMEDALVELADCLEVAAERSKGLEQCFTRCMEIKEQLTTYGENKENTEQKNSQYTFWYETFSKGFILHMTPLDVAALFNAHRETLKGSWVFTSATLQVGSDFNHFSSSLGINDFQQGNWQSPFDYQQQSVLYIPQNLPAPNSFDYTEKLIEKAIPVIEASKGRAFCLFTSYRAMNEALHLLKSRIDYPVLVQGSLPKHQLLEKFKQLGNAVLLGTASFWEGVDVRGEALSCVIIDKLPFASPGDPVMQSKLDAIKQAGGNPFMHYQLPQAVITLKQGVGRLIRDVSDYGVLMLGDPRLLNKPYGRTFLNSLPDMPMTQDIEVIRGFFEE